MNTEDVPRIAAVIAGHVQRFQDEHPDATSVDLALMNYMAMLASMERPLEGYRHSGPASVVLHYGRRWEPAPLPEDVERGEMGHCYSNALDLAMEDPDLTYVEGYAQGAHMAVLHAWCVDQDGRVVDPTWDSPESKGYYGIPVDTRVAASIVVKQGYYGLLANDYLNDHQIMARGFEVDDAVDGHEGLVFGVAEE